MIKVRFATIEDLDQIKEIEDECIDRPWSRLLLEADLNTNPNAAYWVAYDEEKPDLISGFIGTHNIAGEINITNVAVRQSARRLGVGSAMINEMLHSFSLAAAASDFACADFPGFRDGIIGVTLEVKIDNFPAIALYEKYGFKTEGIRKGYYSDGKDAKIMWLR